MTDDLGPDSINLLDVSIFAAIVKLGSDFNNDSAEWINEACHL